MNEDEGKNNMGNNKLCLGLVFICDNDFNF